MLMSTYILIRLRSVIILSSSLSDKLQTYLKKTIPEHGYVVNDDRTEWIVFEPFVSLALRAVPKYIKDYETFVVARDAAHSCLESVREAFPEWAALSILPDAPESVVRAAYTALAKEHHPDVGGSTETMQKLNTAYAALEEWKVPNGKS